MKITTDIDIDLADKSQILQIIDHIPASVRNVVPHRKHPSGIYPTLIPYDPIQDMSTLHYEEAEERGYFKLDMLNVYVYALIKNEEHLISLMNKPPNWNRLNDREFVEQLVHLNNQYIWIHHMAEPVNSIETLMLFLAVIRPAKRHLIGLPWKEIEKTVWDRNTDGYVFRRCHACAYSHLVVTHMNLLEELENEVTK